MLNLSTNSLSPKTCHVLGKVIATDRTFVEIKFADCMLSEDGRFIFLLKFASIMKNHSFISILWYFMTGFNYFFFLTFRLNKINCGINSLLFLLQQWKVFATALSQILIVNFLIWRLVSIFQNVISVSLNIIHIIKAELRISFFGIINNSYLR